MYFNQSPTRTGTILASDLEGYGNRTGTDTESKSIRSGAVMHARRHGFGDTNSGWLSREVNGQSTTSADGYGKPGQDRPINVPATAQSSSATVEERLESRMAMMMAQMQAQIFQQLQVNQ